MIERTTVAIVGAGPTGLLLAGDLARDGVDVTVLERRDTESNLTRAFGVHARTLEHLDARGLADEVIASGAPVERLRHLRHRHQLPECAEGPGRPVGGLAASI
jgi:2-polyprenyl-6-methoxyphenol hydroxylase-like FAD-dependent oxidoreductase